MKRAYEPIAVAANGKPVLVIQGSGTGACVHFERLRGGRPSMGGAGGVTYCGIKFVPRVSMWSRDVRSRGTRLARLRSCADCLREFSKPTQ